MAAKESKKPKRPIRSARGAAARLAGHLAGPAIGMTIPPYGPCRVFAVRGTDGVWLEFFQVLGAGA